jgi:hypothetical protein
MFAEEKEEWLQNLTLEADKERKKRRNLSLSVHWVFRTAADERHASAAK